MKLTELLKFNLLKRNLVGVHGVAMNATQARQFKGLIWCPESNRVLLNKHARIESAEKLIHDIGFRNGFHLDRKLEYLAASEAGQIPATR